MKKHICYHCGKEIDTRDLTITPIPLNTMVEVEDGKHKRRNIEVDREFHFRCLDDYFEQRKKEKENGTEEADWDAVYQFFIHKTMQISEGSRPEYLHHAVNRLLGLRVGRYAPRGVNTKYLKRGYSYRTILVCLKYCKRATDKAHKTVDFKSEKHMIDYLMAIVISNIDFVQRRLDKMDRQNRRIEKIRKEEAQAKKTTANTKYVRKGGGMNRFDWVE